MGISADGLLHEETKTIKMASTLKREKRMRLILQQTRGRANPARSPALRPALSAGERAGKPDKIMIACLFSSPL